MISDPKETPALANVLQKKRVKIAPYDYCKNAWLEVVLEAFPENVICASAEGPSSPSCYVCTYFLFFCNSLVVPHAMYAPISCFLLGFFFLQFTGSSPCCVCTYLLFLQFPGCPL